MPQGQLPIPLHGSPPIVPRVPVFHAPEFPNVPLWNPYARFGHAVSERQFLRSAGYGRTRDYVYPEVEFFPIRKRT